MAGQKAAEAESQEAKLKAMVSRLSEEKKILLLSGKDFWRTQPLPELNVGSLKTTDGPNGARGEFFTDGTPAALFPCGISLAATWNVDLLHKVGSTLAKEAKAKQAQVLLAPTVCLHRSPLGGRNFESFSEDPFITGKLAASYINGLQGGGVAATIKHFVANEQETIRMQINSVVEERALRELYLKPFEIAIRDADPWALMSSYNLVNGLHADMNPFTLQKVLREEWKYKGAVISDWGGTNSIVESVKCGVDLEMPGPAKMRGSALKAALDKGEISIQEIDDSVERLLRLLERTGRFDLPPEEPQEKTLDTTETRELIRDAGVEGLTLLKNENNALPLGPDVKRIALIGPNAKRAIAGGGGSASLKPYYNTTPFDSISAFSGREIVFAQGAQIDKWLPLASNICRTPSGDPGVALEFWKGDKFEGTPLVIQTRSKTDLFLWDSAPVEVLPEYSFKVKTVIVPETTGEHQFGFQSVGPGRLFVNKTLLIDNWDWTEAGEAMFEASVEVVASIYLEAGVPVEILVESTNETRPKNKSSAPSHGYGGCRIGYRESPTVDFIQEATDLASKSDAAVIIVGLDAEWESEGYDRQSMDLPKDGSQDRLISAVAKANPRTIVVNQSGTPVTMPWVGEVPAILQGWYQGQEAGNALSDVLFAVANPSGKLPVTFPKRLEDNPAYHNWPGENQRVVYGEGIYIGYRHYERLKLDVLFPFGHGLSYTSFEYGSVSISKLVLEEADSIIISVPITNIGSVAGKEIVQLYVRDVKSALPRPEKELQGFTKVELAPGETKVAEIALDKYSVGYYDVAIPGWIAEAGEFEALVGSSSQDIRGIAKFTVRQSFTWVF
ncbi:Beta-glucosidase [Dactylella cylindrospora]|nr:Beta-glucosidase [Dactylella cylindrospora]